MLMDGAALLAMHTNLYWRTSEGLQLDSGAYVHALEIATGKQATVLGKPDPASKATCLQRTKRRKHLADAFPIVNPLDGFGKERGY